MILPVTSAQYCYQLYHVTGLVQAVFLDDLGRNLKPAREMGMATVRVRETEAALRELGAWVGVRLVGEEERGSGIIEEMLDSKLEIYRSKL